MKEWLGLPDIADMTGLELSTVYQYNNAGRLPEPDMVMSGRKMWMWATIKDWDNDRPRR
jgi:predicted DNA-binding transcriptional regulator AlpA